MSKNKVQKTDTSSGSSIVTGCTAGRADMKHYLSFGGGVNSTALYFLLMDLGIKFEAIYVDHRCDWPETREYVQDFAKRYPVTILTPRVEGKFASLYDYMWHYRMIPSRMLRFCTDKFKVRVAQEYAGTPCFMHLGIDSGESHRAKLSSKKGFENRYILIEEKIDRQGCKDLILAHGDVVPIKSGCWFCPFQRIGQWRKLRMIHPDLFCKAQKLEKRGSDYRVERGKTPIFIASKPLDKLIKISPNLWPEMDYPPCQCGL